MEDPNTTAPPRPPEPPRQAPPPDWLSEHSKFYATWVFEKGSDARAMAEEWDKMPGSQHMFILVHMTSLQIRASATITKRLTLIQGLLEKMLAAGNFTNQGLEAIVQLIRPPAEAFAEQMAEAEEEVRAAEAALVEPEPEPPAPVRARPPAPVQSAAPQQPPQRQGGRRPPAATAANGKGAPDGRG